MIIWGAAEKPAEVNRLNSMSSVGFWNLDPNHVIRGMVILGKKTKKSLEYGKKKTKKKNLSTEFPVGESK